MSNECAKGVCLAFILGFKEKRNHFFEAAELNDVFSFYENFSHAPEKKEITFPIKNNKPPAFSKLWVEVSDLNLLKKHVALMGTKGQKADDTGLHFEVVNGNGKCVALADYSKKKRNKLEDNKHWCYCFDQMYIKQDFSSIKELFAPNFIMSSPLYGDYGNLERAKEADAAWKACFPDLVVTKNVTFIEDDRLIFFWSMAGTHLGEFKGLAPSKKRVSITGTATFTIRDSKIIRVHNHYDIGKIAQQLGMPVIQNKS